MTNTYTSVSFFLGNSRDDPKRDRVPRAERVDTAHQIGTITRHAAITFEDYPFKLVIVIDDNAFLLARVLEIEY